ncbi:hypothetical protein B0H13DRAFT_1654044 [Mycena leptocephala]|nr:hypothetical protein B0H13DRAFT_1654044 [Mycena leptocephala]
MLSGTAVKAVISYVSDYVSKLGLKTYQAFASVHDVFERNAETLKHGGEGVDIAKTLMRQMVNSMSTKLEIGSPMASMYILGNPDHYKSHKFVNFAWRSYVTFVKNGWKVRSGYQDDQEDFDDMLMVRNDNGTYVASSSVDDYRYRPLAYENVTLFEWIQCSEKKARNKKERADDWDWDDSDVTIVEKENRKRKNYRIIRHPFLPEHKAMYKSHSAHCDFRKLNSTIPNFLGGAVPRSDKGDRDYYCTTMLTFFKPWRAPEDLKDDVSTWDQAFLEYAFTDRQKELIANFNLRYECNDARDDHYAIMRKKNWPRTAREKAIKYSVTEMILKTM